MKRRVVVVGLDGACWEIINRIGLDRLPNLKKMIDEGCSGELTSTIPYITPPAWTSAFTGVNPGKHGIFNFRALKDGKEYLFTSNDVTYEMVWESLGKKDMKTIAVAVPLTYPAKKINGVMVTGYGAPGTDDRYTHPKQIQELIKKRYGKYSISPLHSKNRRDEYVNEVEDLAKQNSEVTKILMDEFPDWDLTVTVFSSPDWIQHFYWDDEEAVFRIYKEVDNFLNWLLTEVVDDETYVLIMSDHGFVRKRKNFFVDKFLRDKGYINVKKNIAKTILSKLKINRNKLKELDIFNLRYKIPLPFVKSVVPRDDDILSFDHKNSKVALVGGNIYVKTSSEDEKNDIKESLENLKDPNTGQKILKHVAFKEEIYWGGNLDLAPDIIIEPEDDYRLASCLSKEENIVRELSKTDDRMAMHALEGIHVVYGKQVKNLRKKMKIWDITPMILHILGQPLYNDMDGIVYRDVFDEDSELRKTESKKIINIKRFSKIKTKRRSNP